MKQDPRFPSLYILSHPLIQHKLSHMREHDTSTRTFRELLKEITLLMGYEITRDLPLTTRSIQTPLVTIDAPVIAGKKLAVVPILDRLGLVRGAAIPGIAVTRLLAGARSLAAVATELIAQPEKRRAMAERSRVRASPGRRSRSAMPPTP